MNSQQIATYATIPADIPKECLRPSLTPGKSYRIETKDEDGFTFNDDDGWTVYSRFVDALALGGCDWLLSSSAPVAA